MEENDLSIKNKIILITTTVSFLSLSLFAILVFLYIHNEKEEGNDYNAVTNIKLISGLIESSGSGNYISMIDNIKDIGKICIYNKDNILLSADKQCSVIMNKIDNFESFILYKSDNDRKQVNGSIKIYNNDNYTSVIMRLEKDSSGYIYIEIEKNNLKEYFFETLLLLISIILLCLVFSLFLALSLQEIISRPISRLIETASEVTMNNDLSETSSNRKILILIDSLRDMARNISNREEELRRSRKLAENARDMANKANIEAQKANKMKSEFLANMSHELRTPLNSLLVLSECLIPNDTGNLNDEQINDIKTIHSSGSNLLSLINDVLDISKIEAGKIDRNPEKINTIKLLKNIEDNFRPIAVNKDLSFRIDISSLAANIIISDAMKLNQIISNFLSNSFKFTKEGGVTLRMFQPDSWQSFDNDNLKYPHVIGFSIRDTGIGIDKSNVGTIFDAFSQEDGSINREYGGTGLGLTISQDYAELLGGEINLVSEKNHGTILTLFLPIIMPDTPKKIIYTLDIEDQEHVDTAADIKEARIIAQSKKNRGENYDGYKVLIVDDEKNNIYALNRRLEKEGFHIIVATNGQEAIDKLIEDPDIDVVLMDIMMPVMDGYTAMEKIRKIPKIKDIPIIAITAKTMLEDKKKCFDCGADDFVSKPVNVEKLLNSINKWLNINQNNEENKAV